MRLPPRLLLVLLLACFAALAQDSVTVQVRVIPISGQIAVDGLAMNGEATYQWGRNTRHVFVAPATQNVPGDFPNGDYVFSHWSTSTDDFITSALRLELEFTGSVTLVQANYVRATHGLKLTYHSCGSPHPSPGIIRINGTSYTCDAEIQIVKGSEVTVEAVANQGFAFNTWGFGGPVGGVEPNQSFVINIPISLVPQFSYARTVTLETAPAGLLLVADRKTHLAPISMWWGAGSAHQLSVVSPQQDSARNWWVFDSWESGQPAAHSITVAEQPEHQKAKAHFVPGVTVSLSTRPVGLKIEVDGSTEWPGYNFIWGEGHTHRLAAPEVQYDEQGRPWVFKGWTNGGDRVQQLHVSAQSDPYLAAEFEPAGQLEIETEPAHLSVLVDGVPCPSPCKVGRPLGADVSVTAAPSLYESEWVRMDFDGWSDGASRERNWKAHSGVERWKVRYRKAFRLDVAVEPAGSAAVRFAPASPDRFYSWFDDVQVYIEPAPGFEFWRWDGAFSGRFHPAQVRMSEARMLVAQMQKNGADQALQLMNGAALTPEAAYSPGSRIMLQGSGLLEGSAPKVSWGGRELTILRTSEGQLQAVLPKELTPGHHELLVEAGGVSKTVPFEAVEGAPGLYLWLAPNKKLYGLAFHEDSTLVTPASPARAGEKILLAGTGFGAPQDTGQGDLQFDSPIEVWAGGRHVPVEQATSLNGHPGVYLLTVQVPDGLVQDHQPAPLWRVRSAGRPSNFVILPLQ